MANEITAEELAAFKEMAASFAKRSIGPILETESPDGDLGRLGALMEEAKETGLLSSADPAAPGYEAGIWGTNAVQHGPAASLMLLEELAVACGGVAVSMHGQGLANVTLAMARSLPEAPSGPVAAALFEGGFLPGPEVIDDPSRQAPARIETVAKETDGGFAITGGKDFVFEGKDAAAYLVFARVDSEWAVFMVPASADGLEVEDAGFRMGVRACRMTNLFLDNVKVGADARLKFDAPVSEIVMNHMRLWNLGLVAIGAGVARGGLAQARAYAEERYQGCTEIINHPGMGALLAESEARIMVCQGLVMRACAESQSPRKALIDSCKARLAGMAAAAGAVTDSLQIFGGYGYMEDYRMEKRYRDINSLKSAGGSARDLRMLIAGLTRED